MSDDIVAVDLNPIDWLADAASDGNLEVPGIVLEVVRHLVTRRE